MNTVAISRMIQDAIRRARLSGTGGGGSGITALTGNVTASGTGSVAATIANDAVTYAKMQNVSAADRLLGRGNGGGAGDVQEIALGTNLSLSGTTLNATATVSDGDKGDITVSGSGATWTIDGGTVTLAKQANLAANSIIGNNTGSPATPLALTASQVKTLLAIAAGDVSGLGTLATQSGTFSGTSSGTNTGDQTNISGNAATVTTNANLTGPVTSVGNATTIAATLDTIPAPVAAVSFNAQQATSFLIENRTNDTGCTQVGRLWLRTDL